MTTQTKQTAKPDYENIATRIRAVLEDIRAETAERDMDLVKEIQAVEEAQTRLQEAKTALKAAEDAHPATTSIIAFEKALAILKKEAKDAFDINVPRTYKDANGAGFQYRASVKTVIADQGALAVSLVENNLWEAAGADLKVNGEKMKGLLDGGVNLDGVKVQVEPSVAILQPKEN